MKLAGSRQDGMRLANVEDHLINRDLIIKNRPIDSVKPNARNARTHSPKQIQQVAGSIKTVGFINPVVVDENGDLLAGHARLLAAELLGLKVIPTICVDHLNEGEKRAYMLADNKLTENAGWNEELVRVELEFLMKAEIDFSVDITGFSTPEIYLLLHSDPIPDIDEEPVPVPDPAYTGCKPGDLWLLGKNRVINGDSRDAKTIDTLMVGALAQMVLIDPPYNVEVQGHVSGLGKIQHREFSMASGEMSFEEFKGFLSDTFIEFARVSRDGSLTFAFMDWRHTGEILQAGETASNPPVCKCYLRYQEPGHHSVSKNSNATYFNSMFELTMATLHAHLLPTTLLQAFNDISNFHPTFLTRYSVVGYQHIHPMFIGKSLSLTKSIKFELSRAVRRRLE